MKVAVVVGARPNFMKAAAVLRAMAGHGGFHTVLVHTGQHYGEEMSEVFLRELEMPVPDVNLGVGSGSHAVVTAEIMRRFEPVVLEQRPHLVLVVGDVNSTVACALVAVKLGVTVGHVEAGLRSGDRTMPEEINRIVTDAISDLLFTTESSAERNLLAEGRPQEAIHFVGNTMIDTLRRNLAKAERSGILRQLGLQGAADPRPAPYAVLTLHRPSNVDDADILASILNALAQVGREVPIIFPVHPRTRKRLTEFGLDEYVARLDAGERVGLTGIFGIQPLGYLDFLKLLASARLVLTDSGGIQEETTILGVRCVTLRENTERPITIEEGTNVLVGQDPHRIVQASRIALRAGPRRPARPPLWDGRAAERIVAALSAWDSARPGRP